MDNSEMRSSGRAKFNILDAVIILLIVLCLVGVYFRYSIMDQIGVGKDLSEFEITFKLTEVDHRLPDFIYAGADVYFSDGVRAGTMLSEDGRILNGGAALRVRPAEVIVDDGDGHLFSAVYPDDTKVDADGSFVCNGLLSDNGYFHAGGDRLLSVGQKITLCTDYATFTVTITDIVKFVAR